MPDLTYRYAGPPDVAAVVALVESAYRGEESLAGWTSEEGLIGGQRTDADMASALIAEPGTHVLLAEEAGVRGELLGDPEISLIGLPLRDREGEPLEDVVLDAIDGTVKSLPRPQRRDPDVFGEAIRRAVRGAVGEAWGKKPVCTVLVTVV